LSSTDTVEPRFALARSWSPSPSRSALVSEFGRTPTTYGTCVANVPLPWLINTDAVFEF